MCWRVSVLQQEIDIGNATSIKHHVYRCPAAKWDQMRKKVNYLLENGLAIVPGSAPTSKKLTLSCGPVGVTTRLMLQSLCFSVLRLQLLTLNKFGS